LLRAAQRASLKPCWTSITTKAAFKGSCMSHPLLVMESRMIAAAGCGRYRNAG
jgi:hypothetical protein